MGRRRNLWEDPVVQHRLQVGGYVRIHGNISQAARRFGHDRKTVRDYLRRYEEFERTGDLAVFLNRPRGNPRRTPAWIEELVVGYYQEEDTRRTCPNIVRVLEEEHQVRLTRQTVYNILRRRGVWERPQRRSARRIRRFEAPVPNRLWQADLIELEETCLGKVYGVVILDDYSRYLLALMFFLTKDQEGVLYTFYLAFCEHGLPERVLVDKGSQFYATLEGAESRFQDVMSKLGVEVIYTSRPQTKGKVEKIIQFIERDFLNVERNRVKNLEDLNHRAERWRRWYNRRRHESIRKSPAERYQPSPHRVEAEVLWDAFAKEERRKIYRDGTIRLWGQRYPVPEAFIGQHAWVRIFYDRFKICVGADNTVIATYPRPP
ncbi:MAG TPA: hypothetical protein ENK08_10400 [Chloroflexi bacterium]|nr:hypothetical protein [Chloroflexota bacterium]